MAWDDTHQTAADPDNPNADEEITANEWNAMVRELKSSRPADWTVYKDSGTWYAEGPDGATETSGADPAPVLQHAVDNGSIVGVQTPMLESNGDRITTTVQVDGALIDARFKRIDGDADPIFDFRANAEGLHNAAVEGRLDGGGKPSNTLIYANESGQRGIPFLQNVTAGFTNGFGVHLAGVQQTSLYNLHMDRCGDFANNGGGLRCTDNEAGDLDTNHLQVYGLQFHGNSMGGPLIKSETINGNAIALNGLKLVGLDAENGNQSGTGGGSAHILLEDAQRLKWSHVYLRGLDAVDYAIDYNNSNGTNTLRNSEIRWDNNVSSGASIRWLQGANLTISDTDLHRAGGGPLAITGDLSGGQLRISDTRIDGNVELLGDGAGTAQFDGGEVDDLAVKQSDVSITGTTVDSTSGGTADEAQNLLVAGGETLPTLQTQTTTDANGQVTLDWEASGILFPRRPIVNVSVEASGQSPYFTIATSTYNSTTYYTGLTVTVEDYSGTAVGSGESVVIDVRAQS